MKRLSFILVALVAPAMAGPSLRLSCAPTVTITSVPPYGMGGSLTGLVTGVANPQNYVAAPLLFIEGGGWWSKPYQIQTTVPVQANGTFSTPIATGGLDQWATIFVVYLVPAGVSVPFFGGVGTVPLISQAVASATLERFGRTVNFANRVWHVKDGPQPVGPGSNRFASSPSDVWVDAQGRLHLTIHQIGLVWWCSEVVLTESLGYGLYYVTTESNLGSIVLANPSFVFGEYTWDNYGDDPTIPAWPSREIDLEHGLLGQTTGTGQSVVQPWSVAGNLTRFSVPSLAPPSTLSSWFSWAPTRIDFGVAVGHHSPGMIPPGNVILQSAYLANPGLNHFVPSHGREHFRLNAWNWNGVPPTTGPIEVIISDFRFSPAAGVFPGGCTNLDPVGSLRVLSGDTNLGNTFTLGIDNPLGTQPSGSSVLLAVSPSPDPAFPCGSIIPNYGAAGGAAELLIALTPSTIYLQGATLWSGAAMPVPFTFTVPANASLLGLLAYFQGVVVAPGGSPVPYAVTTGLEGRVIP